MLLLSKFSTVELKLTMNLKNILINIGLTAKETAVYLAALELGDAPASEIALRSKLNRVTTYDVLEKLTKRSFISSYIRNRIKYFAATDPDFIRKDYRKRYMDLKEALPELRRLHGKTTHPRIRYYEGLDGIKKIYADTLTAKTEILNYADSKSIRDFWPKYDEEYVKERVKRKIYLRGIAPKDKYGERVIQENENMHREIRLTIGGPYAFSNEIHIYDEKVAIISFGKNEVVGMIIEGEEIANSQRAIFMMAWEFAGQQNA
jgi:sugar-specific transcriptional regulator TrmB